MRKNQVAPFEGELVWIGEIKSGVSQRGTEWKVVDFTVKYSDGQREKHITFNAFGTDKVSLLASLPIGTSICVKWEPDAREYNGRWYGKNEATEIKVSEETAQQASQPPSAPSAENVAPQSAPPSNASSAGQEEAPDGDLPF